MDKKDEIRAYTAVAAAIFLFAFLSGYFGALGSPERSRMVVESFFDNLDFVRNLSPFSVFVFIFLNNALKAAFVILFGFFFAIVPLVFIYTNGEIIGLVVGVFQQENSLLMIILGLLPHGILEVPAVVMATGYGIWLGARFYARIRNKEPFREYFYFALGVFFRIILPMLLLAAIIESFITPFILNRLFVR